MTYAELMAKPPCEEPSTPPEGFVLCSAEEAAKNYRQAIKWHDGPPSFVAIRRMWQGMGAFQSGATVIFYAIPA